MRFFLSRRVWGLAGLLVMTACLFTDAAFAQSSPNMLLGSTRSAKDLSFPSKAGEPSMFSTPEMAIYKPPGEGPFPALVLQHQCGGLRNGQWSNQSMLDWARKAVARGYVAMIVDSLGQRGVDTVCMGAKGGVTFPRGVRDTLQAAQHLRSFPFVDKTKIALAGYSWGAMTAVLASGKRWGTDLADGERFQAAVAFYPGCFTIRPPSGQTYEVVHPDIDRPLLVLMGDQDNETPAAECIPRLQAAKDAGAPVEWHVYPDTTHCWDCKNLNNFTKTDVRGAQVVYRYGEAVSRDSEERLFAFLDKALQLKR
ncbi:MAG: dienelactone hydrolase family protein [Pseudomonadota bacterium]